MFIIEFLLKKSRKTKIVDAVSILEQQAFPSDVIMAGSRMQPFLRMTSHTHTLKASGRYF